MSPTGLDHFLGLRAKIKRDGARAIQDDSEEISQTWPKANLFFASLRNLGVLKADMS